MKLTFILFAFFFNFFHPFFLKAEEIIDSPKNQIEKTLKEVTSIDNKLDAKKIHIVKVGDTITGISKLYSIEKELIIKLNDLKDENYIYVGQNLKISDPNQNTENNESQNIYHLVQKGENLTEISVKYGLEMKYLIEINDLKDKDSIEIGSKLFLSNKNTINQTISSMAKDDEANKLNNEDNKIYGPITIGQNELIEANNRKILNALNKNNKKLIIAVKCETKDLDVRIPGRKWSGWRPAKEKFEKNLINDFC
tara:strand:- start:392 stop:1150 length:759 start_codon:yes stop_codon:yes gene_type:complete